MTETIRSREQAEGYVAMVCFKHGPPALHGIELEWTIHNGVDPVRPVDLDIIRQALGPYAPPILDSCSPHRMLAAGSRVTVEPGGQIEISSLPTPSLADLIAAGRTDSARLRVVLAERGLVLGQHGSDAHRIPPRLLRTPRYDAMEAAFDQVGPLGRQMMNATASLQVCVDAGEANDFAARWQAVHALGPPLIALFANSPVMGGRRTGWASSRMRVVLGASPSSTPPPPATEDPVGQWGRVAVQAPLVCMRRGSGSWTAPRGMTFADWIAAGLSGAMAAPAFDDLDYHLTTLFPPVRPRGYLEIRYVDQQPGDSWSAPLVLIAALLSTPHAVDLARAASERADGRWVQAAREGLADRVVCRAAADVVEVGLSAMTQLNLSQTVRSDVSERLSELLAGAMVGRKVW